MIPRSGRSIALATLVVVTLLGATGCGDDGGSEGASEPPPPAAAPVVDGAATDLRVDLDRLLGEHALMATFSMHKRAARARDREAVAAVVDANAVELGDVIEAAYGAPMAASFRPLWRERIADLDAYAQALASRDPAGRDAARADLNADSDALAALLADASPELPARELARALRAQTEGLTAAVAGRAAAPERAYRRTRAAYAATFRLGDAISAALVAQFPDRYPAEGVTPRAAELRVDLDRLLGEHAVLTAFAMQMGILRATDFQPLRAALGANTRDLGATIGAIYGARTQEDFVEVWATHVEFLVAYTLATAGEDTVNQQRALRGLEGYRRAFDELLGRLSPDIGAEPIAMSLQTHVDQLTAALTTFAAGNHEMSYGHVREAYHHMFATGDVLAAAIVADRPERFVAG